MEIFLKWRYLIIQEVKRFRVTGKIEKISFRREDIAYLKRPRLLHDILLTRF